MSPNPPFREAKGADAPVISLLARTIWYPHYLPIIGKEQIDYMLFRGYTPESLGYQMQKGQRFLLGLADSKPVAYASWSIKTDGKETWVYLNKLYALAEARGKGLGLNLLEHVVEETKQRGIRSIRLNVNKYNPTCSWYFQRGFRIRQEMVLEIGNGFVMDDYILELNIPPDK